MKRPFLFAHIMNIPRLSLRYKIISLFVLAILLPAFLVIVVLTTVSRQALRTSIFHRQQETVNRVADLINSQITRHQQLLFLYRDSGLALNAPQAAALIRNSGFTEFSLLNARGQEVWKYRRTGRASDLVNRSRRREFLEARAGRNYVSPVSLSGQRQPYILLSVPLGGRSGVLVAKLDLDKMWQWISEIKIGETGQAFVVDRKGNLIAHREPERVWAHSNFKELPIVKDYMNGLQSAPGSWREYRDERGEKVVALYQALPKLGWAVVSQIPSAEVYYPIQKMRNSVLFWTFCWTGIFLFVGLKFVQRITNPLALLRTGAEQISRGKLDIKLDIRTGDEIEELAHNFEKMAASLKQLEEVKQDLTRMIIHDLKSPLSGIMGSLDYLESGATGDFSQQQKKILSLAKKSSETMLSMIQNLLDVAKMEEGKLELHREKTDITVLLGDRKGQFDALVAAEGKTLVFDAEPGVPLVDLDRDLVERVVNNLLTNALHHTSSGGKITLGLKKKNGSVEISVSDNGMGIPEEYRTKIFEKFVQIKRREAHLRTGAGLGLTFCKMAVESHRGEIRVESELNKGSSFIFTLPL